MNKKIFKYLSIISTAILILMLIIATIVEKYHGTEYALENFYSSPLGIALWAIVAISGITYFFLSSRKPLFTIGIHISFILILLGAILTHLTGIQGAVHLRKEFKESNIFYLTDGSISQLPFRISLENFDIEYYPGTKTPANYISTINIDDNGEKSQGVISMNNIYTYKGFRFYQSNFDKDMSGSILTISYDPYGITVTYIGYAMLIISFIGFFFQKGSMYRTLIKRTQKDSEYGSIRNRGKIIAILLLLLLPVTSPAQTSPEVLPQDVAEDFCDLHVLYNGRIAPIQTLAKDFTTKLYGEKGYKGYSAEQVFTGLLFFFDSWKKEPIIKIEDNEIRNKLGIKGEYASLNDFYSNDGEYKLEVQFDENGIPQRNILEANEKFSLAEMAGNGLIMKMYPVREKNNALQWYSFAEKIPVSVPYNKAVFIQHSMNYIAEQIARQEYDEAKEVIKKIREYQAEEGGELLPSEVRFRAEKLYNELNYDKLFAIISIIAGLLFTIIYCVRVANNKQEPHKYNSFIIPILAIIVLYLTFSLSIRYYISGHIPLSNGFEVMQFMALSSAILGLVPIRSISIATPLCTLLCGLVLLVATMSESNPTITPLMPVLQSPLLSIHVAVIMIAYSVFGFCMLNGIIAIILRISNKRCCNDEISRLADISLLLLYPAIFLLVIGIFVGAVWANISWGRYWGWDPKEVWALITMLIYSALLHRTTFKWLRSPMAIHLFCIVAFLSVLITYFGVNLFLGGMHSYS